MICKFCKEDVKDPCHNRQEMEERAHGASSAASALCKLIKAACPEPTPAMFRAAVGISSRIIRRRAMTQKQATIRAASTRPQTRARTGSARSRKIAETRKRGRSTPEPGVMAEFGARSKADAYERRAWRAMRKVAAKLKPTLRPAFHAHTGPT